MNEEPLASEQVAHGQSPTDGVGTLPRASGLRASLNRHRTTSLIVFGLVFTASVARIVWWSLSDRYVPMVATAYYTVDDGATLFVADNETLPPFDHDGKKAVRAFVFTCDGGKTRFVGYLQKLPEAALAKLAAEGRKLEDVDDDEVAGIAGWMAKRPGEKEWVNSIDDRATYEEIRKVVCPGSTRPADAVLPPPRRLRPE